MVLLIRYWILAVNAVNIREHFLAQFKLCGTQIHGELVDAGANFLRMDFDAALHIGIAFTGHFTGENDLIASTVFFNQVPMISSVRPVVSTVMGFDG